MHIQVFGEPVKRNPIRLADAHQKFVLKEVADVIKAEIVFETGSDWASATFCVAKPHSSKLHLIIDYRGLNA